MTGKATIEGGLVRFNTISPITVTDPFSILTASAGREGEFVDLLFDDYFLTYDDNNVFANLHAAGEGTDFCDVARTANHQAVCGGLVNQSGNEIRQVLIDNIVTEDEARDT